MFGGPDRRFGFNKSTGMFRLETRGMDAIAMAVGHAPGRAGRASGMMQRVKDWRPYLNVLHDDWCGIVWDTLKTKGGRGGKRWVRQRPNTTAKKQQMGLPNEPQVRTGDLFLSLGDPSHPHHYQVIRKDSAYFGSSLRAREGSDTRLWQIHDRGTKRHKIAAKNAPFLKFYTTGGWRRTKAVNHPGNPMRSVAAMTREDVTQWIRWAQQYAVEGITLREPTEFAPKGRRARRR
jgi:hypothetical protein